MKKDIRFIEYNGKTYMRKEDVIAYIKYVADFETVDVRNRWYQVALNLSQLGDEYTVGLILESETN